MFLEIHLIVPRFDKFAPFYNLIKFVPLVSYIT